MIKPHLFAILASFLYMQNAMAENLVVVSFGGANQEAQAKAFYDTYSRASGQHIVASEYSGEMAKIRSMVDTKSVNWDVVEVGATELARGCEEGMFEVLDWKKIPDADDFVPGAQQKCGAGIFVWSTVLAYDASKLKQAPRNWRDFWDLKKFPGKRAMHKGPLYNLEIALLADGVARQDIYKELSTVSGVNRAFKKLDEIKPYIQWWESGSQPAQYLAAGDVVMSTAYNGRIATAQQEGKPFKIVWDGSIYDFDYWAIPKGSKNVVNALKFIANASKSANQKTFSEHIGYGPASKKALGLINKQRLADLPNAPQNSLNAISVNTQFWLDNAEALEQRFNAWAAR